MTDDQREREPLRDRADHPPEAGTRSDQAGTGTGVIGPAPGGGDPDGARDAVRDTTRTERDTTEERPVEIATGPAGDAEAPTGMGDTAGGGYGSGLARGSSGGSGDGAAAAGDDAETDWLRSAPKP